jgi:hypothetical protein
MGSCSAELDGEFASDRVAGYACYQDWRGVRDYIGRYRRGRILVLPNREVPYRWMMVSERRICWEDMFFLRDCYCSFRKYLEDVN